MNPDVKVTFRTAYDSYEEGTQKILREAVTNQLPDVTFQGLNRVRILVDRDIRAGRGISDRAISGFPA